MKQTSSLWLFTYWNTLRNGRKAPNRFEIEPVRIGPLLPETFILEANSDNRFRFRLAGTRICDTYGLELKGMDFLTLWRNQEDREALESLLLTVREDGSVGVLELTALNEYGESCRFEVILLPLTHAGGRINRIMGILAPLEDPYWLGSKRITEQSLDDLDLVWPDTTPSFAIAAQQDHNSVGAEMGRIVSSNGRLFRVLEGGKKDF